jgi:methionine salvage enolase-phosphatase E1
MKPGILIAIVGFLSTTASSAQIKNAKTETIKVYGNCGMCETTIEKAGSKSNLYKTDWNVDTKMASITYDSKKTSATAVMKSIALSGYDNDNFLAPDDAYNKLHECCKYDRESKTAIASNNITAGNTMQGHSGHGQENNTMNMQELSQLKGLFDHYFALKDALVKTDAGHIKENKDIEQQREHFMSLSKNMYELIKAAKPAEAVYYQFCPMANDGKGANWLSKETAIKNPYYGSQMLSCGKVVETIKQ